MTIDIEITCQAQRNIKIAVTWCDLAQYQQLCAGCAHNTGRKRSKYQLKKYRANAPGKGQRS
ncbi:MAG: hypothetical protein KJ630_01300 [Proteobacteria bacterium]|nr:hypothetical protein [Pseudomonadota bacterium]